METYDYYCKECEKTTPHKLNGDCLECILKYVPPVATDNTLTPKENSAHSFTEGEASEQKTPYQILEDLNAFSSGSYSTDKVIEAMKIYASQFTRPSVVTQSEKGAEEVMTKLLIKHDSMPLKPYFAEHDIYKAMREYSLLERSRAIDECLKIAESISFDTEDQAGIKFVAVVLDELKEKLKSRQ